MKIPPKKPHFFKPILPGFKDELKIPKGFLKYLKGHDHIGRAILKTAGNKWLVKLNGRRLEEGWKKFAEELNLQLGEFLIFRHEGDMEFEVSIFDSSHCQREYGAEKKAPTPEETLKKFEFEEKPSPSIKSPDKASHHAEAATHKPFGHSKFVFTIRPYCLTYGFMYVPIRFAYANGLTTNKKCGLIIKDDTERSWNLRISSCKTQVYIGDGYRKFIADNCLKEGDRIMFEVVTDGETPIWKFHVVTDAEIPRRKSRKKLKPNIKSSHKAFPDKEVAKDMLFCHPRLISTVKPYWISRSLMHVPKLFALESGLINRKCRIMIRDEQRSWTFRLYESAGSTFIGGGWRKFCAANFLKEGDRIMLEIFSNGEKPILKFNDLRDKTMDATTPMSQMPASTSADVHPHYISTIKPYTFTKAILYLPMDFVKSNDLMSRSEMILVDEKQRSWSVCLGRMERHFGIKSGWPQFRRANGVEVGDTYKFELTNNGTIPIVHFHCKYSGN